MRFLRKSTESGYESVNSERYLSYWFYLDVSLLFVPILLCGNALFLNDMVGLHSRFSVREVREHAELRDHVERREKERREWVFLAFTHNAQSSHILFICADVFVYFITYHSCFGLLYCGLLVERICRTLSPWIGLLISEIGEHFLNLTRIALYFLMLRLFACFLDRFDSVNHFSYFSYW